MSHRVRLDSAASRCSQRRSTHPVLGDSLASRLLPVPPPVSSGVQNGPICVGLMIGFIGVVALLGIGFRGKTEELIGAGAG
jgi:hypothetical protein